MHPGAAFATWGSLAMMACLTAAPHSRAVEPIDEVVDARIEANREGVESQQQVDELSDETDRMVAEYRGLLQQLDALRIYNRQIDGLIASQDEEMTSLQDQIDDVELVGRQVMPLMLEMVSALEAFVEIDVPFLPRERRTRLEGLRDLFARADVTDAERFRRILEAYQIENEYGRTIEAYSGELAHGGQTRTVDFLRVGRVVFIYQTRDASEGGVWDQDSRSWQPLADEYRRAVRQGLRIARKDATPDLLRLPVPAAKAAQ